MATIIMLGDPHVGKGTSIGKTGIGTALNSRIVDQIKLLDWTLDQAIERNASHIIITGDVFEDPKPHPTLITLLLNWINKCAVHNVTVGIIRGNHDILRTGNYYISPLDIINECGLDNCHVYSNIDTIYIDSVAFTFLPFRDRKSFNCESNAEALNHLDSIIEYEFGAIPLPYAKVLVGHLALEGSIMVGDEIDDLANELFCPLSMIDKYDYVWMGHVHKPQILSTTPHIAHIGSMDISNFGETDHKKNIIVFHTDPVSFETVEIPTRNLAKIAITVPKDTVDTTQYVLDEIKSRNVEVDDAIVRLEITLATSELKSVNRTKIEKHLNDSGVFNLSGFTESKRLSAVKKAVDGSAPNISTSMDVPSTIKMWAQKKWPDDIDEPKRLKFIDAAMAIHRDFLLGLKQ